MMVLWSTSMSSGEQGSTTAFGLLCCVPLGKIMLKTHFIWHKCSKICLVNKDKHSVFLDILIEMNEP